VDGGEPGRALVRAEVGREDALRHAPPPKELARPARRPSARRTCHSGISTATTRSHACLAS
jgi:hypothetical protein